MPRRVRRRRSAGNCSPDWEGPRALWRLLQRAWPRRGRRDDRQRGRGSRWDGGGARRGGSGGHGGGAARSRPARKGCRPPHRGGARRRGLGRGWRSARTGLAAAEAAQRGDADGGGIGRIGFLG